MRLATLGMLALLALLACGEGDDGITVPPTAPPVVQPPAPPAPITYLVAPPAGKLPWPQHDPAWDAAAYADMMRRLHIGNNFALYQASGQNDPSSMYLHGGLDVLLPNGTPIHAVQAGVVRAVRTGTPNYESIVVEDERTPGHGWLYVHVTGFRVKVGDRVQQGTRLAHVQFLGIEHVHLDRVRLITGGSDDWSRNEMLLRQQPDTFFHYVDTEPPVFEGPFRYLRAGTDVVLATGAAASAGATPPELAGDVDVVAGLRDPGEHARQPGHALNDRLAVSQLRYAIVNAAGDTVQRGALDLTRAALPRGADAQIAQTVFAPYERMMPGAPPWWQTRWSHYVVTNLPTIARPDVLSTEDRALSWNTLARTTTGQPRFPNGDYRVVVWAADFKGNASTRTETVRVRN